VKSYIELLDRLGEEAEKRGEREVGKTFRSAREYVRLFSKYGIIKVSKVGRAYVITLNREGKITKAVIEFLREVGYL